MYMFTYICQRLLKYQNNNLNKKQFLKIITILILSLKNTKQ